jgi:hypothetical protein
MVACLGVKLIYVREVRHPLATDRLLCCGKGSHWELRVWSAKLVQNNDVHLLEMLHQGMQVVDLETTAGIVPTQFVLAIERRDSI